MIRKNKFAILVALIITYLSLTNAHTFDKIPLIKIPNFDKVVHFGMYFSLMSVIILENRRYIKSNFYLFLTGLIPLFFGVLLEILQATITTTRSGSIYDAMANTAGVLFSILLWLWIKPIYNRKSSDSY